MTDLNITTPCAAEWNSMSPVAGGRHCSLCAKTVIDLTCLGAAERDTELSRIAILVRGGNRVCIRTSATRDGRVLSASRRILSGGMAAMLAMAVAGCQGSGNETAATHPDMKSDQPQEVPEMKGEAQAPHQMFGKVSIGDVMMGEMVVEPPHQNEPVAPHAAQ